MPIIDEIRYFKKNRNRFSKPENEEDQDLEVSININSPGGRSVDGGSLIAHKADKLRGSAATMASAQYCLGSKCSYRVRITKKNICFMSYAHYRHSHCNFRSCSLLFWEKCAEFRQTKKSVALYTSFVCYAAYI